MNKQNIIPWLRRTAFRKKAFRFNNEIYFYDISPLCFDTERIVELPILKRFLNRHRGKKILEIGNVSSHCSNVKTLVVDKYDPAKNVFNMDAVDMDKYCGGADAVVSISTLEHIGRDEEIKDPEKAIRSFELLLEIAKEKPILITIPFGYHEKLVATLSGLSRTRFMRRNIRNEWRECAYEECKGIQYGYPFRHANAIAVYLR